MAQSTVQTRPPNIETNRNPVNPQLSQRYSYLNQSRMSSSAFHLTPPSTPQTIMTPLSAFDDQQNFYFPEYLRAFCAFHPSPSASGNEDCSITIPITPGDVILVHSIQPNGWADGTLLTSGARGWLPTNYCEPYEHDSMQHLLHALTYAWEFIRSHEDDNPSVFATQDYVRGMIAGVRILLVRSDCLSRDDSLVKTHVGLRRLRKSILADLSAFVKAAKRLQELCKEPMSQEQLYEILDDIVYRACKIVTRAVKFSDVLAIDVQTQDGKDLKRGRSPPLTPAADTPESKTSPPTISEESTQTDSHDTFAQRETTPVPDKELTSAGLPKRLSKDTPRSGNLEKRMSACHRVSYSVKSPECRESPLASDRLATTHDAFLGSIASFIGLQLQSRLSVELLKTTQQAVITYQALVAVVDEIWDRDERRSTELDEARDVMHGKLAELVQATQNIFKATDALEDSQMYVPNQNSSLMDAATSCVRAAGDCVAKTKTIIERIGDFECEALVVGTSDSTQQIQDSEFPEIPPKTSLQLETPSSLSQTDTLSPNPVEASSSYQDKPLSLRPKSIISPETSESSQSLPRIPKTPPIELPRTSSDTIVARNSPAEMTQKSEARKFPSLELDIPPVSPIDFPEPPTSPRPRQDSYEGSMNNSIAESTTQLSSLRHSETSLNSQNSTQVTTPDRSPIKDMFITDLTASIDSLTEKPASCEDTEDPEEEMLVKTYAHELIFNKEGQITGGSLPALIERLTTHDSTPDATFVNTFFLTFRLFTTPVEFAKSLIHRFDYVAGNQAAAVPVRLRVYNIFKGWLETHWKGESDCEAIDIISQFANGSLKTNLPSAGKRLTELIAKVSDKNGTLVPRLVSTIGKTSTAITSSIPANAPAPNPAISKSQINHLRKAENGNASCSILDFDALELARQFTIIESKYFCSIQPEELLGSAWMKDKGGRAANVRAMSTLSTDLANLVADTILQPEEPKKRAVILKQWVKIAKKCRELNNYDSLLAIICSLNSSMVSRLKRTWDLVPQKTLARLDELRTIVDCSRNYANLRQLLQNHVAPCIPFVGLYLTDLTFVDVGNQTRRQLRRTSRLGSCNDGIEIETDADSLSVINFDKHMKTAKIVGDLQRFQIPYNLQSVQEMQDWMESQINRVRNSDQVNVQTFYRRSLMLEPRETCSTSKHSPIDPTSVNSSFSSNTSGECSSNEKDRSSGNSTTKEKFEFWTSLHFNQHGVGGKGKLTT